METIAYVIAATAAFWVGMITSYAWGGMIFILAAIVLTALKAGTVVTWSWMWSALPLWAALGGAFVKMRAATRDHRF